MEMHAPIARLTSMLGLLAGLGTASGAPASPVAVVNQDHLQIEITEVAQVAAPNPGAIFRFRNRSDVNIVGVDFYLWGPDCPRERKKPLWPVISYGLRSAGSQKTPPDQPALHPAGEGQARVPQEWIDKRRRYARSKGCDESAKPELIVSSIRFENGETWTNSPQCRQTPELCDGK
jgi:hypothetical protein